MLLSVLQRLKHFALSFASGVTIASKTICCSGSSWLEALAELQPNLLGLISSTSCTLCKHVAQVSAVTHFMLLVLCTAGRSLMDIQKDEEARAAARAAAQPVTSDVKTPAPGRAGHWGAAAGPAVKSGNALQQHSWCSTSLSQMPSQSETVDGPCKGGTLLLSVWMTLFM